MEEDHVGAYPTCCLSQVESCCKSLHVNSLVLIFSVIVGCFEKLSSYLMNGINSARVIIIIMEQTKHPQFKEYYMHSLTAYINCYYR